jgi:hypothetical protein
MRRPRNEEVEVSFYAIEGDTFTHCYTYGSKSGRRPEKFAPGPDNVLRVMRRVKR